MKITATTAAYISEWSQQRFVESMKSDDPDKSIDFLMFAKTDAGMEGWTKAGTAHITVEILDDDTIRSGMVDTLKEQRKTVLAEAQLKAMQIDEKIQSLLAIEYVGQS